MKKTRQTLKPEDMVLAWFGYGTWSAPYWFIGPEPGMGADEGQNLDGRYRAWVNLGGDELLDCAAHHAAFGLTKWHRPRPPTQPTWRQLIRLLLAYKGVPTDLENVRRYQRSMWGATSAETCVVELSALAARNLATPRDRTRFRNERIRTLSARLREHSPEFVVCYGERNREEWELLPGKPFDSNGISIVDSTVFATTPHPVGGRPSRPASYWVTLGNTLRTLAREQQHSRADMGPATEPGRTLHPRTERKGTP